MKKTILSLLLAVSTIFGIDAAAVLNYSYADGPLFNYGKSKKEVIDVAIRIDDPALAGMKLVGVKAYISTASGITNTSVWGTKTLMVEKNVNQPDLFTYPASPVPANVGGKNLQMLSAKLTTPYVLTNEPVYIGYSMEVTDNTTEEQKNPIVLSKSNNPNGLWLHMTKSILLWANKVQETEGVAYIVAEIEGDFPDYSLGFSGNNTIFANDNEDFEALFMVSNIGANTINSLKYTYSYDGSAAVMEGSVQLPTPVEPDLAVTVPVSLSFNGVSGFGPHKLAVNITEVNGNPNEAVNSSTVATVNVIPFMPVHRPLIEEFTDLQCGWCPRGWLAMEKIEEDYGSKQVSICYHDTDPMSVTRMTPIPITGLPSACVDRQGEIDPYYGSTDFGEFAIANNINEAMDEMSLAAISVNASVDGDKVNATADVTFIMDIDNANYKLGYVLVCNGLSSPNWGQWNYFDNYKDAYRGTGLEILTTWPDPVYGLVYNTVAVDVTGMMGISGTLPASIETNKTYSIPFTFNIKGNKLINDPKNLIVTAFVINGDTGKIENANKFSLDPAAVENITNDKDAVVISEEYFDLSGRKITNPSNGIFIIKKKMSDGKIRTSKVLIK